MAVLRVNKTKDYTVMSNTHLRDKRLTLKAKGLLSVMLSLPDNWDYSVDGLVAISKENKTAIQNTLKELETCGYLERTRTQDGFGRFDYIYDIFEQPKAKTPQAENLFTDNLFTESPCTENQPQLNTNIPNTKEQNTNISNTERKRAASRFTPPTVEEVQAYCQERQNNVDPQRFVDYYTANGWKVGGRAPMKDWKAAVRNWERQGWNGYGYGGKQKPQQQPKQEAAAPMPSEYAEYAAMLAAAAGSDHQ